MSSTYGNQIKLSIFGQSHAPAIGVVLDGLPAGEPVDLEELNAFLRRRAPGQNDWSTPRKEADSPEILSGLVDGVTCGAPLAAIIRNTNTRPADYAALRDIPRPGHADFTAHVKYGGHQDVAGGGHFSGRLTAPLCIAGGICLQLLRRRGILIGAHIAAIGPVMDRAFDPVTVSGTELQTVGQRPFPALEPAAARQMQAEIAAARSAGDSVGGIIECAAIGLPAGLGAPMFDGMESRLAALLFGIPAVKGVEFGSGFAAAAMRGSAHNDPFTTDGQAVRTKTNHHGGILGGITSGMPLLFRVAVKPTPSISVPQESVSLSGMTPAELQVTGRHDPCIVPRAVPCMEAAMAIALLDALLETDHTF